MEHLPHGTGKQTHQLFGWPVLIQNDFLPAESTADPLAPALFLQLASFHDPKRRIDVSWGDAGYLFFAISPEALATRRFAAMTGELQCT
jgi:uncharacterized protein YwqG